MRLGSRTQVIVALALTSLLSLASLAEYLALRKTRAQALAALRDLGTAERNPEVARDLGREPDPVLVMVRTARALLAEELDRSWMNGLSETERAAAIEASPARLAMAEVYAERILERRPASWQALMTLGGARYLRLRRAAARSPWHNKHLWTRPLEKAIAHAPGQPEPKRILTAFYLNEWSIVSDDDRWESIPLIREAFSDFETLEQFLPTWLRVATSFEQVIAAIPAEPRAWRILEDFFRDRKDWERLAQAKRHFDSNLPAFLEELLQEATLRQRGGDREGAARVLMQVVEEAPIRVEYRDLVERAVIAMPPTTASEAQAKHLGRWLDWARDQCLIDICQLAGAALPIARLSSGAASAELATASLIAGDLQSAEAFEERSRRATSSTWSRYFLLKSASLLDRADADGARAVLEEVQPAFRHGGAWHAIAARVGRVGGEFDTGWLSDGDRIWRRELVLDQPVSGFELRFLQTEPRTEPQTEVGIGSGGVAEVRLDGSLFSIEAVTSGTVLRIRVQLEPGYHILELEHLAGRPASAPDFRRLD